MSLRSNSKLISMKQNKSCNLGVGCSKLVRIFQFSKRMDGSGVDICEIGTVSIVILENQGLVLTCKSGDLIPRIRILENEPAICYL